MARTVIFLRGGIVQGAVSDVDNEIMVVDFDVDGKEADHMDFSFDDPDVASPDMAWPYTEIAEVNPARVDKIFDEVDKRL